MKKLFEKTVWWVGVLCLGIIVGVTIKMVGAWVEPGAMPPGGNIAAPLNTGNIGQAKIGGLTVNIGGSTYGLIIDKGLVGIQTTTPKAALDVNGDILGHNLNLNNNLNVGGSLSVNGNFNVNGSILTGINSNFTTVEAHVKDCNWGNSTSSASCPSEWKLIGAFIKQVDQGPGLSSHGHSCSPVGDGISFTAMANGACAETTCLGICAR